jgi:Pyridoxamine 5'-phosphate oxidase
MAELPPSALEVLKNYRTCELTTLSKDGSPVTWPVCARRLDDGRFLSTTSIAMPQKAFNIRRNPKVSLLFSEPTGSGVKQPGAVLVQGNARCDDRIVTDMSSVPELETFIVENIFSRQPNGKFMSSWLGKSLFGAYYMRLLIYVTPSRIRYWPTRDFSVAPQEIELSHVG